MYYFVLWLLATSLFTVTSCYHTQSVRSPYGPSSRSAMVDKIGENDIEEYLQEIQEGMTRKGGPDSDKLISNQLPIEINESVKKWLVYFTDKDHERFQRYLDRGAPYRSFIEQTLDEYGVPPEIYYLALIESGFAVHARSHARAVGVWQFMAATARRYDLRVDQWVDERRDPYRATRAAARYLADLHNVFQSWYLAMAAYNAGEARIMRAIMSSNTRNFWELVNQKALPRETRQYIPKFIAAVIIARHPEKFGFVVKDIKTQDAPELVSVPDRIFLKDLVKVVGVSESLLKQLNPHLSKKVIPRSSSGKYAIWLPKTYAAKINARRHQLAMLKRYTPPRKSKASRSRLVRHRVRRGETLTSIAQKYRVPLSQLRRWNGIRGSRILVGQRLKVYRVVSHKLATRRVKSSSARRLAKQGNSVQHYRVRRGDSLWDIARRFGVSLQRIKRLNGLRHSRIMVGQLLRL